MMRFLLPAALAFAVLTACGPFVDVVDVKKAPQITRNAAMRIRVYPLGMPIPTGTQPIGPIEANSCKNVLWDPPATTGNALQQLQLKALQIGANAVVNVTFDTRGTDAYGTNCWQSVTATGFAATVPE